MKSINLLIVLTLTISAVNAQITNTTITLTAAYDQIRFEPSGHSNRYFFMSKPASSIAFGHYSPEDGGWFTYWKTGSGDMIVNKGKVGIGTSSPNANLHISSSTSGNSSIRIEADTDNNDEGDNPMLEYIQDGGQVGAYLGFDNVNFGSNIFGIGTRYSGADKWNVLAINTQNGNIGIGTKTPNEQLHVANSIRAGVFRFNSNGHIIDDARYNNYILSWDWDGNYGDHTKINWGGNGEGTDLIISEAKGLIWDGKFTTEEVQVEVVNPPDFVFDTDYYLMPLAEIEAFVKQNHHLPEVPSAAEMQANGVELGKMNMLLLQKVEELTLHMIEQNKKIKLLLQKAAKQDEEIKELKNNIK